MSHGESVSLSDLLLDAQSGFACGERDDGGIAQIRMNNISISGDLVLSSITRIPKASINNIEKYFLHNGDVLFNSTNGPNLVGKTALYIEQPEPFVFRFSTVHLT